MSIGDLHEGNVCLRRISDARERDAAKGGEYGYSGVEVTILDYGLSRAADDDGDGEPIAYDLERDLSIFTSDHAPQCEVYRRMRTHLLRHSFRAHLGPAHHAEAYASDVTGRPIDWRDSAPYTNALWLAYLYRYLVGAFAGHKGGLEAFRRKTREMWGVFGL